MTTDIPEQLAMGSLVTFAPAPGHSQPDLHAGAPITLVPGVGEPLVARILAHTPDAVDVAVGGSRLTLTPVAATLEEGLDYQGAWAVRSIAPATAGS